MDLHLTAEQDFDATPEAVFALTVDPERFPAFFTGFGPIPAVEAITLHAGICLHMNVTAGRDPHHIVEAQFKAFARALRAAVEPDPRVEGIPSTKGAL